MIVAVTKGCFDPKGAPISYFPILIFISFLINFFMSFFDKKKAGTSHIHS